VLQFFSCCCYCRRSALAAVPAAVVLWSMGMRSSRRKAAACCYALWIQPVCLPGTWWDVTPAESVDMSCGYGMPCQESYELWVQVVDRAVAHKLRPVIRLA
jgi:hypothetical protein